MIVVVVGKMNTSQINRILKHVMAEQFLGVFPSDQLPSIDPEWRMNIMALVANKDPASQPGSHWIAFFIEGNVVEYFDSYGLKPALASFLKILDQFHLYKYNTKQIQGNLSSVCGHYCVYYITQRWKGFSMEEILNRFSTDLEENDLQVTDWLNEKFDLNTSTYNVDFIAEQICHALLNLSF